MGGPGSGPRRTAREIFDLQRNGGVRRRMTIVPTPVGLPTRPENGELTEAGLDLWDRLVPFFVDSGFAGEADTDALTAMCRWWELYDAEAQAGHVNPAARAWREFDRIARRYGYTALDRAKMRTTPRQPSRGVLTRDRSA